MEARLVPIDTLLPPLLAGILQFSVEELGQVVIQALEDLVHGGQLVVGSSKLLAPNIS